MKCLIIGFGKIAQVHTKYLDKQDIEWFWYDPFASGPEDKKADIESITKFDRVMICSPEDKHYQNYKQIRELGYKGYIFIEKPVATKIEHVEEILSDSKVVVGMVERFNPAIHTLKSNLCLDKIVNIDFSRCCVSERSSRVSILEDIGIHDIDLLFFLLDIEELDDCSIVTKNKTTIFTSINPLVRMIWSKETFFKERKIVVRQTNCTYEVDLQEQSVVMHWESEGNHVSRSLFVEKSSPIENEHHNFFSSSPDIVDCWLSHKILLNVGK